MYLGQRMFKKQRFEMPTKETLLFGTGCVVIAIAITGIFAKFGVNIIITITAMIYAIAN